MSALTIAGDGGEVRHALIAPVSAIHESKVSTTWRMGVAHKGHVGMAHEGCGNIVGVAHKEFGGHDNIVGMAHEGRGNTHHETCSNSQNRLPSESRTSLW